MELLALVFFVIIFLVVVFLRDPRKGLLFALVIKPVVDMFWWAKGSGALISPLVVVAIIVPVLGIVGKRKLNLKKISLPEDRIIISYLLIFGLLALFKIALSPHYFFNTIDTYARILSVTLFYFIGKYYFQEEKDRTMLVIILIYSAVVPFLLTAGQGAFSSNLTHFKDVYTQGEATNMVSAYYLHGRHDLVRISGVYEGVYELAFLSSFTLLFLLVGKMSKNVRLHPAGLILIALSMYYLYFTYSRSAWAVTLLALSLFLLFKKKTTLILLLYSAITIAYVLVPNIQYRFEDELGFVSGNAEFNKFGYGRGGKWLFLLRGFNAQDFIYQLFGNYGIGNPENQFINTMFWNGYIGLIVFIFLLAVLTFSIIEFILLLKKNNTFNSNILLMCSCLIISTYWIGGLGNGFNLQISSQWVLWLWTGIILREKKELNTLKKRKPR